MSRVCIFRMHVIPESFPEALVCLGVPSGGEIVQSFGEGLGLVARGLGCGMWTVRVVM